MHLVATGQVDVLRKQLAPRDGLSVGSIEIETDPFDFARTGAAMVDRAVAFSSPEGVRLAGLGTAWRAAAQGIGRFADLKQQVSSLEDLDLKAFLGFSFLADEPIGASIWDGYAPAEVFVPRISIEGADGGSIIRVAIPANEDPEPTLALLASMRRPEWSPVVDLGNHATASDPSVRDWASSVSEALGMIESGELEKVVLARSVVVTSETPPAILRMFRELARSYPRCYNFAWKSGDAVFMGASPELLASVRDGVLHSNPLAGSAPRGEGREDDEAIGDALLASRKDRNEHAYVVDAMTKALIPIASEISASNEPMLKKMASVQHLSSIIDARLMDGLDIFDVIAAVHPTPAVGGVPTKESSRAIAELETIERGWYTGGVGWVDGRGNGAVALGLRCGLIRGVTTHLFAGAGIVAGSEPDKELQETRLKLEPLLRLLTAT